MTQLTSDHFLHVRNEIDIEAPIAMAFEALLEQLGPASDKPDGEPLHLTLEAWPGGRWFRDTGNKTGHLWGHVQVIKPPTLLELTGPLFMSYPAISHVQWRLTENAKTTRLSLVHRAMGDIDPQHREGVSKGWGHMMSRIRERAVRVGRR